MLFGFIDIRVIVVLVTVVIVELAKKFIFKDDPKYKPIYTFAPVVLCAIAYLVIALIQKADIWTNVLTGAGLGFTAMGSYDAIVTILRGWFNRTPAEIVKDVTDIIDKGKEMAKK